MCKACLVVIAAPQILGEMIERLYVVLEDHKNFELLKPKWFQPEMVLD